MDRGKIFVVILIALTGAALIALVFWLVKRFKTFRESSRIYHWLDKVTSPKDGKRWRSTVAIASHTNLTEDRVRLLCRQHKMIVRSSKKNEVWGIKDNARQ